MVVWRIRRTDQIYWKVQQKITFNIKVKGLHLLVRRWCRQFKQHLVVLTFRPILHIAFIHGDAVPSAACWGWGWRGQRGEGSGAIWAFICGWKLARWILRIGRVARAAHGPWVCSRKTWLSTTSSCCWSWHVPSRGGIHYAHVGDWVRRGVWKLTESLCRTLSQIGDSHSTWLGVVGERGRLRASSACHPWCDGFFPADLRSHHVWKWVEGGKYQREPALPLCPQTNYSASELRGNNPKSFWKPRRANQLALADS